VSQRNQISGGPIRPFTRGWAKFPFVGKRAHHWEEVTDLLPPKIGDGGRVRYFEADCGAVGATNDRVPALEPGSWDRCKVCEKRAGK